MVWRLNTQSQEQCQEAKDEPAGEAVENAGKAQIIPERVAGQQEEEARQSGGAQRLIDCSDKWREFLG